MCFYFWSQDSSDSLITRPNSPEKNINVNSIILICDKKIIYARIFIVKNSTHGKHGSYKEDKKDMKFAVDRPVRC